jgi:hypothetical protein
MMIFFPAFLGWGGGGVQDCTGVYLCVFVKAILCLFYTGKVSVINTAMADFTTALKLLGKYATRCRVTYFNTSCRHSYAIELRKPLLQIPDP